MGNWNKRSSCRQKPLLWKTETNDPCIQQTSWKQRKFTISQVSLTGGLCTPDWAGRGLQHWRGILLRGWAVLRTFISWSVFNRRTSRTFLIGRVSGRITFVFIRSAGRRRISRSFVMRWLEVLAGTEPVRSIRRLGPFLIVRWGISARRIHRRWTRIGARTTYVCAWSWSSGLIPTRRHVSRPVFRFAFF
jgi:hypothetical protein